jgi:archaellum component FlaC
MKKISTILFVALLMTSIVSVAFIGSVKAVHTAKVAWVNDSNGVFISETLKAFPSSLAGGFVAAFTVTNLNSAGGDYISAVRVVINRTVTTGVLLKYSNSSVYDNATYPVLTAASQWIADPSEFDSKSWPGTITFRALPENAPIAPIYPTSTYVFVINFTDGPTSCNYLNALEVYTEDIGKSAAGGTLNPETHLSGILGITIDNEPPSITTVPTNGTTVDGIIVPCGQHYFNISVSANDMVPGSTGVIHDTGISWVTIWVDGIVQYNSSASTLPGQTWVLPSANNALWNMPAGTHNMTVTAWDGVGNPGNTFVQFTYVPPPIPDVWVTPNAHASPNTWFNSTSGLLESEQVNYTSTHGVKTLGTWTDVLGWNFHEGVAVTVNITLPYGIYTVAKTTTDTNGDGNGTFATRFVFPETAAGIYTLWVYSTPCNKSKTVEVTSEVIYKPDLVVGPAPIEVIATGFTAQNVMRPSWFFIVPDALQGVNTQVDRWWYIDGNGTLQNWLNTYTVGVENVSTTLNWPWLEPGTYTVEIKHIDGDWWNGTSMTWVRWPCFVGGNTITVKETLSLLISIKDDTAYIRTGADSINAKLDTLKPIVDRIDGNVVTLSTTVGNVQATLNQLSPVITRIDGNVVTLSTTVGQINTTMATIGPQLAQINWNDITTIKTSVGTGLSGTVTSIQGDVATIKTDAGDVHAQLPNVTNYIILVIALTLIAALAAIACLFLVFRKIA